MGRSGERLSSCQRRWPARAAARYWTGSWSGYPETGYTIARIAPERGGAELVTAVGPLLGAQVGSSCGCAGGGPATKIVFVTGSMDVVEGLVRLQS